MAYIVVRYWFILYASAITKITYHNGAKVLEL